MPGPATNRAAPTPAAGKHSLVQVKVPDPPVANGCPQLKRGAKEGLVENALQRAPLVHHLLLHRVPRSVLHKPARNGKSRNKEMV